MGVRRVAHQQFALYPTGDGWYGIVARHSGKAPEVDGGPTYYGSIYEEGVGIRQYSQVTCGQWKLEPVQ